MTLKKCDFCGKILEERQDDIYQMRMGIEILKKSGIHSKRYHEYDMCIDCYNKIIDSTFKNGRALITEQETEDIPDAMA